MPKREYCGTCGHSIDDDDVVFDPEDGTRICYACGNPLPTLEEAKLIDVTNLVKVETSENHSIKSKRSS